MGDADTPRPQVGQVWTFRGDLHPATDADGQLARRIENVELAVWRQLDVDTGDAGYDATEADITATVVEVAVLGPRSVRVVLGDGRIIWHWPPTQEARLVGGPGAPWEPGK